MNEPGGRRVTIDGVEATEDALLAEYSAAQDHVGVINTVQWQSAAIVLGGALAAGGLLAANIEVEKWQDALLVSVGCGGLVLVIILWLLIWCRHSVAQENIQTRMRDVEKALHLRRNIYMDILRHPNWGIVPRYYQLLTAEERARLATQYRTLPWPSGGLAIGAAALIIVALLISLGVGRWLQVCL